MAASLASTDRFENLASRFPRKIQIDDHEVRTLERTPGELLDIADGPVAIRYDQDLTLHPVLLKSLPHQARVRFVVLDQENRELPRYGVVPGRVFRKGP